MDMIEYAKQRMIESRLVREDRESTYLNLQIDETFEWSFLEAQPDSRPQNSLGCYNSDRRSSSPTWAKANCSCGSSLTAV